MALIDSGSSLNLVRQAVRDNVSCVTDSQSIKLTTMNGDAMWTKGQVMIKTLLMEGRELGPVEAHVVASLPGRVDLVLELPTLLRHGCWIGQHDGRVAVHADTYRSTDAGGKPGCDLYTLPR